MSDWIMTHTGKHFFPLHPKVEDIDIEDIAHALSNICRYTGHCSQFYSVAQHSVLATRYTPIFRGSVKLAVLLHDGSEAYLCDLSRPVKHDPSMQSYRDAEETLQLAIEAKFGIDCSIPIVKEMDNRMLFTELRDLMPNQLHEVRWGQFEPFHEVIVPWSPTDAKAEFLKEFYQWAV